MDAVGADRRVRLDPAASLVVADELEATPSLLWLRPTQRWSRWTIFSGSARRNIALRSARCAT